jgi:hypothetical protein
MNIGGNPTHRGRVLLLLMHDYSVLMSLTFCALPPKLEATVSTSSSLARSNVKLSH